MRILADNESLGCSQNPLNTPNTGLYLGVRTCETHEWRKTKKST